MRRAFSRNRASSRRNRSASRRMSDSSRRMSDASRRRRLAPRRNRGAFFGKRGARERNRDDLRRSRTSFRRMRRASRRRRSATRSLRNSGRKMRHERHHGGIGDRARHAKPATALLAGQDVDLEGAPEQRGPIEPRRCGVRKAADQARPLRSLPAGGILTVCSTACSKRRLGRSRGFAASRVR